MRLTNKDWNTTKFMELNERKVLRRLWELENQLDTDTKFKVGDTVYYIEHAPLWNVNEERPIFIREAKIKQIYIGKTKTTYYVSHYNYGMAENRLFSTAEEAKDKIKQLKEHNNDD